MTSPFEGTAFVVMWIGFLVIMSSGIVIFFLWAMRAGQLCEQERARHLPLKSGIPPAEDDAERDHRPDQEREPGDGSR